MKKRFITLFICLLCTVFVFSGCGLGSYITNNKDKGNGGILNPGGPNGSGGPENPGKPAESNDYTATVYYNNKVFDPGDYEITVVWRNSLSIVKEPLGADGKANAGVLDGDYNVYLEGLPDIYSYNPGGTMATDDQKNVAILITDIRKPVSGTGTGMYNCFVVNHDGTYRAEVKKEGQYVFYQYAPMSEGWYKIESWVNAYDDEVDPYIQRYGGTFANKWPEELITAGGFQLAGGFTKNFRYDVQIAKQYVGNTFTFAVTAASKFNEFPVKVDFAITYMGEYRDSYYDVRTVRAKEATVQAAEPEPGETFKFADMGTYTFDMANYKFNDETGLYHRYDTVLYADNSYGYGVGYGPVLYCNIKNAIPSYTRINSLYTAHAVSTPYGTDNFLLFYNVWLEDEQKHVTLDYKEFIRQDYGNVCNSQGYCYVTTELKEFLQDFAMQRELWTDGVDEPLPGEYFTPEHRGYFAKQDALWLFACGFYS